MGRTEDVAVVGELPAFAQEPALAARAPARPTGERQIYLGGWRNVPIYAFDALAPEQVVDGPAVIESATKSVLLRSGDRSRTTAFGWLDVEVASK